MTPTGNLTAAHVRAMCDRGGFTHEELENSIEQAFERIAALEAKVAALSPQPAEAVGWEQWTCECNYMNEGPICTHCGKSYSGVKCQVCHLALYDDAALVGYCADHEPKKPPVHPVSEKPPEVYADLCQSCGGPLGHKAMGTAAICDNCLYEGSFVPPASPVKQPAMMEVLRELTEKWERTDEPLQPWNCAAELRAALASVKMPSDEEIAKARGTHLPVSFEAGYRAGWLAAKMTGGGE